MPLDLTDILGSLASGMCHCEWLLHRRHLQHVSASPQVLDALLIIIGGWLGSSRHAGRQGRHWSVLQGRHLLNASPRCSSSSRWQIASRLSFSHACLVRAPPPFQPPLPLLPLPTFLVDRPFEFRVKVDSCRKYSPYDRTYTSHVFHISIFVYVPNVCHTYIAKMRG